MKQDTIEQLLRDKLHDLNTGHAVPSWSDMLGRLEIAEQAVQQPAQPNTSPNIPTDPAGLSGNVSQGIFRQQLSSWAPYIAGTVATVAVAAGVMLYNGSQKEKTLAQQLQTTEQVEDLTVPGIEDAIPISSLEPIESTSARSPLAQLFASEKIVSIAPSRRDPLSEVSPSLADQQNYTQEAPAALLAAHSTPPASNQVSTPRDLSASTSESANIADDRLPANPSTAGTHSGRTQRLARNNSAGKWDFSAFSHAFAPSSSEPFHGQNFGSASLAQVAELNGTSEYSAQNFNHLSPISLGLGVRKYLTDKWALESGITYTFLQSSVDMEAIYTYGRDQQVHYLGIPLYVSYSLVNKPRWNVYLTGGLMGEAVLSGRLDTKIAYQGIMKSHYQERLHAKGILWSSSLGAGVSYNFLDNFGIYFEPAAVYCFSNPNHPITYYTQDPWRFKGRIGFRFNFR